MGDASPSVPLHQVCLVLSIAPSLYLVLLSHCTSSVTVGKGAKWASQIRRLARPTWGLTPRAASRLYIGVALPRILYGLDIWCHTPRVVKAGGKPPKSIAYRKLASVQREGALARAVHRTVLRVRPYVLRA